MAGSPSRGWAWVALVVLLLLTTMAAHAEGWSVVARSTETSRREIIGEVASVF